MKRIGMILAIIIAGLFFCSEVYAASVTFAWDANSESDLAGYRLYQADVSGGPYAKVGNDIKLADLSDQAAPTWTIQSVSDGTHYWVLTAYDTSGNESGYSNEVSLALDTVPPQAPGNLVIK